LAIHIDWEAQARAIVEGVRIGDDKTRVLLVDPSCRVIASSDGQGLLSEHVPLALNGRRCGFSHDRSAHCSPFTRPWATKPIADSDGMV
jgi:hypothetical protein